MKVLGIDLYDKGRKDAIAELLEIANSVPQNKKISASDAHVLVFAKRSQNFNEILESFYWNLPDGVPSVWILRLKGAKRANRISGPEFFKAVIDATKTQNINHFLCGGPKGVAEELKTVCKSWGNENIVGTLSPPFRVLDDEDYREIGTNIDKSKANIVWVGLGAPKQIYFTNELVKHCNVQAIITIGAAFDFHTNRVKKAPKWIQKIGMEWFYRLLKEPRRLFGRYFKTIPLFMYYGFIDVVFRGRD
ncbi:MAG: WecB/TagA/CpsF family glycosyltransferase [Crocinitomicaceae bacterium]